MAQVAKLKIDIKDLEEAGFDQYLNQKMYDIMSTQRQIPAQNIAGGRLSANTILELGNGLVKIDGLNRRIIISDGEYDRILIGYQSQGF